MVINFDRDAIVGALKELVDELVEIGASAQIRIVGGAAIAVSYTRESTTIDIDACAITAVEDAVALFEHYYPEDELSERARRQLVGRLGRLHGRVSGVAAPAGLSP